jgi:hypothetical protein
VRGSQKLSTIMFLYILLKLYSRQKKVKARVHLDKFPMSNESLKGQGSVKEICYLNLEKNEYCNTFLNHLNFIGINQKP